MFKNGCEARTKYLFILDSLIHNMQRLYIDLETFSSVNIKTSGAYKYFDSIDFEILILCYAINDGPVKTVDLAAGDSYPQEFLNAYQDSHFGLYAHNANFERNAFKAVGMEQPIYRWHCTAVKSSCCGLPRSLAQVSDALKLEEKGKLATGNALIRFFSCPIKPTQANGERVRNFWHHDLEKWEQYKEYCANDVEAEREIEKRLRQYKTLPTERQLYIIDQEINDRGIKIDTNFAQNAIEINAIAGGLVLKELKEITELENPNSPAQLKQWLSVAMKKEITSLAKKDLGLMLDETDAGEVLEVDNPKNPFGYDGPGTPKKVTINHKQVNDVLQLRKKGAKTSIKKYSAMLNCVCDNFRAHGLFEFCAAGRTGRWAGRLIQLQNLPQNHLDDLDYMHELVSNNDYDTLSMLYDNIPNILSQLVRTAFIPEPGNIFGVADFSAIEARVLSWLANEKWRMDVFAGDGKIYEASAAAIFNVPIEQVTKGSDYRATGKVAELAFGYQGGVPAFKKMPGGDSLGLTDVQIKEIVRKWRKANPCIVDLWAETNECAIQAVKTHKRVVMTKYKNLVFEHDGTCLTIELPSGRKLFYYEAQIATNNFGDYVRYKGLNQTTKKWDWIDSYGGKFIENIVQAIARDLLAASMVELHAAGFDIVMHVHDEVVAELDEAWSEEQLKKMCYIMGKPVNWAPGLILTADGYTTAFYKKD